MIRAGYVELGNETQKPQRHRGSEPKSESESGNSELWRTKRKAIASQRV